MAGSARRIVIEFLGEDRSLGKTAASVEGKTSRLGSVMGKVGTAAALGLAAAGAATIAWGVESVKSLSRIEQINAQTETAIKSTGGAAGVSAKHVENLAGKLEDLTATEAETTQENANLLLTFTNVRNEAGKGNKIFDRSVSTFVDMQRAIPSASMTALGKALNDPIAGISALTRLGVSFTQGQKDQIKSLVESGNTMKAQKIILAELNKEFGGSGEAFAATTAGRIELAKHAFGTLGETIFAKLLPPLGQLAGAATAGLRWLDSQGPALQRFTDRVANALAPALQRVGAFITGTVAPALQTMGTFIGANIAPLGAFVGVLGSLVLITKAFAVAQALANSALLANPIGITIVAIAALAAGLVYAYKHSETFRHGVDRLRDGLAALAGRVADKLKPVFDQLVTTFQTRVLPAVTRLLDKFVEWGPTISKVAGVVGQATGKVLELAAAILGRVLPPVIRFAGFLLASLVPAVIGAIEVLGRIVGDIIKTGQAFGRGIEAVGRFATAVDTKIRQVLTFVGQLPGKVLSAVGDLGSLLYNAGSAVIQGLIDGITSKISSLTSKLSSVTNLIPKFKGPLDKDKILLQPAGVAIMEGLIAGIDSRKQKLTSVLTKLTAFVKSRADRLKGLVTARDEFAAGFGGSFSSSVFGADTSSEFQPPDVTSTDAEGNTSTSTPDVVKVAATVDSLFEFQRQQEIAATQLRDDVANLLSKGLSQDLIRQMAASGSQGIAQIRLLATASAAQVQAFNNSNAATQAALQAAGMQTANALMQADIKAAERELAIAKAIEDGLERWSRKQDKDTIVKVILDGRELHGSLLQIKRKQGKGLGLD